MSEIKQPETMKLWESVCHTDPEHTKPVKKGAYKFTAIDAQQQIKTATALWGPFGNNWGVTNEQFTTIGNDTAVIYDAILYYPVANPEEQGHVSIHSDIEIIFKGGSRIGNYNGDFTKKVATDALTKGLSKLGFNADVFEGKFDDNKYVQEMQNQFHAPPPMATDKQKKDFLSYCNTFDMDDKGRKWVQDIIKEQLTVEKLNECIATVKNKCKLKPVDKKPVELGMETDNKELFEDVNGTELPVGVK